MTQDKIEKIEEYLDTETPVADLKRLFDKKLPVDMMISNIQRPLVRNICAQNMMVRDEMDGERK